MKLKLISPFQSFGLVIRGEIPVRYPQRYAAFWDKIEKTFDEKNPYLKGATGSKPPIKAVKFTHASRYAGQTSNRYSSIDTDSLLRPLHVLEIYPDPQSLDFVDLLAKAASQSLANVSGDDSSRYENYIPTSQTGDLAASMLNFWLDRFSESPQPMVIRVYNNTIGILEIDLPIGDSLFKVPLGDDGKVLKAALDRLQQIGVAFAEELINACQKQLLMPLFNWINYCLPEIKQFIHTDTELFRDEEDFEIRMTGENKQVKIGPVLWVSRALLFEKQDEIRGGEDATDWRHTIISHWLKDAGGPEIKERVQEVQEKSDAYLMKWSNYLFRGDSYPGPYPAAGWHSGSTGLARPFCYAWEGLINAQYYYAAFDVLQTLIYRILALSFANTVSKDLRSLKQKLDDIVKEANLLILDFQENYKYYQRDVATKMAELLEYWGLEKVLLKQIERSIEICNQRLKELHTRDAKRSALYTDGILAAIGVLSVFSILLSLLTFGRNMAKDASLAVFERGSRLNVVDWIASHSTDGILLVAGILSGGLVALYFYFKSKQLL